MKKNLLKIYESFFDDLDKLNKNQDDGFRGTNGQVYDEHDYILSLDKNPEFFKDLCEMCEDYFPNLPSNKNEFTQKDLDEIIYLDHNENRPSYFKDVTSLDELQYFHNLEKIEPICLCGCTKLKSVIFPKNLKIIEYNAFEDCNSLKEVIFPKNIKIISYYSFIYCSSLEKIVIPKKFKNDIEYIFSSLNLSKVNITYI